MAAVVIDASAVVEIFIAQEPDPRLRRRVMVDDLAAPEVLDTEVLNVLRRLERAGRLSTQLATRAAERLADAPIVRTTHRPLIRPMWELRNSVTAYDAAYIALAEELGVPLLTCDAKLARSHGHSAKIEFFASE